MEELSATTVAKRFAAAVAAKDEAAARTCARLWQGDRDGPARLYNQLAGQPVELGVVGSARTGVEGRAAQPMAILQNGQPVEQLTLIGDGEPFLIAGVATDAAHLDGFLAGTVPAVLAWDELTPDPAARAAAETLVATIDAAAGQPASEALAKAMSSAPGAITTIGRLVEAASRGGRIEILEARGLPRLGRAVISAQLVIAGANPEPIYLYVDDATRWRAWTPYFSGSTLLAR